MFDKILVPTDGSVMAENAVAPALEIAKRFGAKLRVVAVLESRRLAADFDATALYEAAAYRTFAAEVDRQARSAVERMAGPSRSAGVETSTAVRQGAPAAEIVAEAKEWGAQLIVLSTHGHTGVTGILFGGVARRVIHDAPCPVLTCRPEAAPRRRT